MSDHSLSGPSDMSSWEIRHVGVARALPLCVMILPDAANRPGLNCYYAILSDPVLMQNALGDPIFSLTLALLRQPNVDEQNITPLIQRGVLNFEASLKLPAAAWDSLRAAYQDETFYPLFARQADFELIAKLEGKEEHTLARVSTNGTALRASFAVNLDPAETLDVLSALDGVESSLWFKADLRFRTVNPDMTIHLTGEWGEIYDFIFPHFSREGEISRPRLRDLFDEMIKARIVSAFQMSDAGKGVPLEEPYPAFLFDAFMSQSSVLLERRTRDLVPDDENDAHKLGDRPHPMSRMDYRQKLSGTVLRRLNLQVSLDRLLQRALDGRERARFIHLVSPDRNSGIVGPRPRRMRTGRATPRGNPESAGPIRMDMHEGTARSLSLALKPSLRPTPASAVIASDLLEAGGFLPASHSWWLDDLVIEGSKKPPARSLPVVDNPESGYWVDRVNPSLYWYAPVFEVVSPVPNANPQSSPFLFTFERVGMSSAGKPALVGRVKLTLAQKTNPAAQSKAAAVKGAKLRPIQTNNLSVTLDLPFVDETDSIIRRHPFAGTVTENADSITVFVDLLNDWVRVCYAVLAEPGFQAEPARLQVAYTFEAYAPIQRTDLEPATGGKFAALPVTHSRSGIIRLRGQPHFDSSKVVYRHPLGETKLNREMPLETGRPVFPEEASTAPAPRSHSKIRDTAGAKLRAIEVTTISTAPPAVVSRPKLRPTDALQVLAQKTGYARRTLVRQDNLTVLFPCREMGEFYREASGGSNQAVGCQDALELGRITYRQYEEIRELAQNGVRVFRSLQQPSRFMVLPGEYLIARYSADVAEQAYQPAMIVYSVLDPVLEASNRIVYHASLQANFPPFARRALLSTLQQRTNHPVIEYPTEIEADVEYTWMVDHSISVEAAAVRTPDSFLVSLATDLPGALILKAILENTGVMGTVTFKLRDGSQLPSTLAIDLRRLTGPWDTGPIQLTRQNSSVLITNKINNAVDIGDLLVYHATGLAQRIAVETTLAPSESCPVELAVQEGELYPTYSVPAGSPVALEEIRNLVEDVHTNVIFIDLVNYNIHNLRRLAIKAQMKGFGRESLVAMSGDPPRRTLDIILPLTVYLEKRILLFQVTKVFTSGASVMSAWIEWDLRENGNIIGLNWEMIK